MDASGILRELKEVCLRERVPRFSTVIEPVLENNRVRVLQECARQAIKDLYTASIDEGLPVGRDEIMLLLLWGVLSEDGIDL